MPEPNFTDRTVWTGGTGSQAALVAKLTQEGLR